MYSAIPRCTTLKSRSTQAPFSTKTTSSTWASLRSRRSSRKVVAIVKTDGTLCCHCLSSESTQLVPLHLEAFSFGEFNFGEYKTYKVPVAQIEDLTGLDFGELRQHDPLMMPGLGSASQALVIGGPDDIVLETRDAG